VEGCLSDQYVFVYLRTWSELLRDPNRLRELRCVYQNRGHPDNENQSDGRTETIDSNIFKSSQSNVRYKTMKSKLVRCDAYATKAPSTRIRIFSKTEIFFSVLAFRPHVYGVFDHWKRRFSKTLSRVENFENGDLSYSWVFVWTGETEVFEYDDVILKIQSFSRKVCIFKTNMASTKAFLVSLTCH